ncbi:hypothetical protein [Burkholderia sp. S171]|uniref:hypothetical protein n=1 Tax=Burkholderia sp. S171 TaxID=1641860 RepID=UPI001C202F80|nr:hypothetical protein [Burkholderia sp. S171]
MLIGALLMSSGFAYAEDHASITLPFETHAAYFSREVASSSVVDPQVFVLDKNAPAERHWQNIEHVAGERNANPDDAPGSDIYNTTGSPLGMTLGEWFHAGGNVKLEPRVDGREDVKVALHGLKPGGRFSLFETHFDQKPFGFTPLDGSGTENYFSADDQGLASVTLTAPEQMTHANAVLVVYHSDNVTHGKERGSLGETAHHQLIRALALSQVWASAAQCGCAWVTLQPAGICHPGRLHGFFFNCRNTSNKS